MSALGISGLIVVGLGAVMVAVGSIMNVCDWQTAAARKRREEVRIESKSLSESINALTKLLKVVKDTSQGTQLIVLGIVVLLVGAALSGVGSL